MHSAQTIIRNVMHPAALSLAIRRGLLLGALRA
jgi:hypothetical protein